MVKKNISKHKILAQVSKFAFAILRGVGKICIGIISLFEIPIFLITHYSIFRNKIILVFYIQGFGDTIMTFDYASRMYYPNRISLIYIKHPLINVYLPQCFDHNIDLFYYKGIIPFFRGRLDIVRYDLIRLFLLIISGFTKRFSVIESDSLYKTFSLARHKLYKGYEQTNSIRENVDYSGYMRLIREDIGEKPLLPLEFLDRCRSSITSQHNSFYNKPFVTLLLRRKEPDAVFVIAAHNSGPQENYVEAVTFLTTHGYNVVGTGETRHAIFKHIPGYFSFDDLTVPKGILNLFLLMNCSLFIGQQSGPCVLPSSCGIPCLIVDAMPYHDGAWRAENIILFKHLRDCATGKRLSLVEVFRNHQDLAYGYHFAQKNIEVEPNTSEEILEAVKEQYAILRNELWLSDEDKRLCEAFRRLPTERMLLRYSGTRTSLHILRRLKHELLQSDI